MTLPEARYATSADVRSLIDAARVRLARIPGVEVVSGASGLPYLDGNSGNYFQPTDRPVEGDAPPDADMRYVAPDYFAAC